MQNDSKMCWKKSKVPHAVKKTTRDFQWFCPRTLVRYPKTPQRKKFHQKWLVKGPGYLPGVCRSDLRDLSLLCWQKKTWPKDWKKLPVLMWKKWCPPPFPARWARSRWCCSSSFHRCQVWRWFLQNTSWNQSFFASLPVTRSCRWISKTRLGKWYGWRSLSRVSLSMSEQKEMNTDFIRAMFLRNRNIKV